MYTLSLTLTTTAPNAAGEQLLVSPPRKPDIGPVAGNTGLLSRLDAFLQEAGKASDAPGGAPAEKLELEDDCDGEHIELDMSCGVFDLKNDEAVRAAEAAVRSGGGGGGGGGEELRQDRERERERGAPRPLVEVLDEENDEEDD